MIWVGLYIFIATMMSLVLSLTIEPIDEEHYSKIILWTSVLWPVTVLYGLGNYVWRLFQIRG